MDRNTTPVTSQHNLGQELSPCLFYTISEPPQVTQKNIPSRTSPDNELAQGASEYQPHTHTVETITHFQHRKWIYRLVQQNSFHHPGRPRESLLLRGDTQINWSPTPGLAAGSSQPLGGAVIGLEYPREERKFSIDPSHSSRSWMRRPNSGVMWPITHISNKMHRAEGPRRVAD